MYHIGVGFEVVRFDKIGLPGPQFVKRAMGKFTLFFLLCYAKLLFNIKKLEVCYNENYRLMLMMTKLQR